MEPVVPAQYDDFEVDEINIYVYKGARVKDTLRFVLKNYIFYKEIEVVGIKVL